MVASKSDMVSRGAAGVASGGSTICVTGSFTAVVRKPGCDAESSGSSIVSGGGMRSGRVTVFGFAGAVTLAGSTGTARRLSGSVSINSVCMIAVCPSSTTITTRMMLSTST